MENDFQIAEEVTVQGKSDRRPDLVVYVNGIAVAVIEVESDSFDTHEYLNSVKAIKDASFARYYDEYKKKYTF